MASNEKTAKLQGSLLVTPTGIVSPAELISILMETGSFTHLAKGTVSLATSGTIDIDFSDYGMATAAHFLYFQAKDIISGAARTVKALVTQDTTAVNGLTPSVTFATICTDFFHLASENVRLTEVLFTAQNAGAITEINWMAGGS